MLLNNPEFVKNVKLEFSWKRFLIPISIIFLFYIVSEFTEPYSEYKRLEETFRIEAYKSRILFLYLFGFVTFFSIIWGTYLSANSFISELNQKTWDFLRMSTIAPNRLFFGKIFGAPIMVWLLTIFIIFPLIYSSGMSMIPEDGVIRSKSITVIILLVAILSSLIITYTLPLIFTLYADEKILTHASIGSIVPSIVLFLIIGKCIVPNFHSFSETHRYEDYAASGKEKFYLDPKFDDNGIRLKENSEYFIKPPATIEWYKLSMYAFDAISLVVLFFAFWSIVGGIRITKKSLKYSMKPKAWCVFILSSVIFINGFHSYESNYYNYERNEFIKSDVDQILFFPLIFLQVIFALNALTEMPFNARYKKMINAISRKDYSTAFENVPLWMITFLGIIFVALQSVVSDFNSNSFYSYAKYINTKISFSILMTMFRDILFVHAISWNSLFKRKFLAIITYLLLAYFILPIIDFSVLVSNVYNERVLSYFWPWLPLKSNLNYPVSPAEPQYYWLILVIQILLAAIFFIRSYKKTNSEVAPL